MGTAAGADGGVSGLSTRTCPSVLPAAMRPSFALAEPATRVGDVTLHSLSHASSNSNDWRKVKESNLWRHHQLRFSRPFAPASATFRWWAGGDSNPEKSDFKSDAFTDYATSPKPRLMIAMIWSDGAAGVDSNPQPPAYKAGALPLELRQRRMFSFGFDSRCGDYT